MHNPYATSNAGEGASPTTQFSSTENARASDYECAIGPNHDYYRPRFERYDEQGAGISWHWPAFFATSSWYVYRKLYLVGILNFFFPWVLWFGVGFLIGIQVLPPLTGGTLILFVGPLPWLALTMFANRIYWRRVRRIIAETPAYADAGRRRHELQLAGGVARGPMVAMALITAVFSLGLLRVVAATVIPAYQDFTFRGQVAEGIYLAGQVKPQVAEYRMTHPRWPKAADLELGDLHGKFTESVTVDRGSIIVTFSKRGHSAIAGKRVVLSPGIDSQGWIAWACGNAALPKGFTPSDGPHGSEVPDKYLPPSCRGP